MIYHTAFFKLKPEADAAVLESMIRSARTQLLKIPETLAVRSGKCVDAGAEWPFFFSIEVDSLAKLRILKEDAIYLKFYDSVIRANTTATFELKYELDPSRDAKYS